MPEDIFTGGAGNQTHDGGVDLDTVEYAGFSSDYTITRNPDGSLTVIDNNTGDELDEGTDTLHSIERIRFLGDGVTVWYPAVRLDDETLINEHTAELQYSPQVLRLEDGRVLFTFETSNGTDGDNDQSSIAARVATIGADGSFTFTDEVRVNVHTAGWQEDQHVIQLADGRLLFVFRTGDPTSGDFDQGSIATRLGTVNPNGSITFTGEIRVNNVTVGEQTAPQVVQLADGRVLFTFQSWNEDGDAFSILGRVGAANPDGTITFSAEFNISSNIEDKTFGPGFISTVVTPFVLPDGRVVVTYIDDSGPGDASFQSVVARVLTINPDGSAVVGGETLINQHTLNSQFDPSVIRLADGRLLFTFVTEDPTDGDDSWEGVAARIGTVNGDGTIALGDEFRVNEHTDQGQDFVEVLQLSDGRLLFLFRTWDDTDGDDSVFSVAARIGTTNADGTITFGEEFRINEHIEGEQTLPQMTELEDGRILVTFTSGDSAIGDGDGGIAARILNLGGAGTDGAETLVGLEPGVVLTGHGGNDRLVGTSGDDLFMWNAGDGRDVIEGGDETVQDTAKIFGDDTAETFTVHSREEAELLLGYDGDAEIVITRNGAIISELSDIEDIVIDGRGDGSAFNTVGSFDNTGLAKSTIVFIGSDGDDTVDLSAQTSEHRVVFQAGSGNDTITGDREQDLIDITGRTIVSIEPIAGDRSRITFDNGATLTYDGSAGFTGTTIVHLADELRVNEHIGSTQDYPQVIQLADGRLLFTFRTRDPAEGDDNGDVFGPSGIAARVGTPNADGTITFSEEIRVNEHIADIQNRPQVAQLADGRVLFTYDTNDPTDGDGDGAVAARIGTVNANGTITFAAEFRVNEHTFRPQDEPHVALLSDGRVMFTFETSDGTDGDPFGSIAGRVGTVNPDGSMTFGEEFRVNEHTTFSQRESRVIELADNRVLFTFETLDDTDGDDSIPGIAARVGTVNPDGTVTFSEEIRVNEHIDYEQEWPEVVQLADGRVLFTFESWDQTDGDDRLSHIAARVGTVEADGSITFGDEFRVNEHIDSFQDKVVVTALADGSVLFLFRTYDPTDGDDDSNGIAARIGTVEADNTITFSEEFRVNEHITGLQDHPQVQQLADGRVLITFDTYATDDGDDSVSSIAARLLTIGGNGTDGDETLIAIGPDDTLLGAGGSDLLLGSAGGERLDGGPGQDLLRGRGGPDTFVLGDPAAVDTILDFNANEGRIDVSPLFPDITLTDANAGSHLRFDIVNGQTILQFDPDGPIGNGAGQPFQDLAVVNGLALGDRVTFVDDFETGPVTVMLDFIGALAPLAMPDTFFVVEETPLELDALANDSFGTTGIDLATGVSFSDPANGGLAFDPNTGLFTYTPDPGFTGSDTFTYTIANGSDSTTDVTLSVRDPVVRLGDEFRINEHITGAQNESQLAQLDDGRVVFVFKTADPTDGDASTSGIGARVGTVNADGSISFTDELRVNEHTIDEQRAPQVTLLADGRALFTFVTEDPTDGDASDYSVAGRIGAVNGDGTITFGDEFRVNEHTDGSQSAPEALQLPDGRIVFLFFTRDTTDGDDSGSGGVVGGSVAARIGTPQPDGSVIFTDEFRVNEHTVENQTAPEMTLLADGRVLFTFQTTDITDGDNLRESIAARVGTVNPDGSMTFGEEIRVNQHIQGQQRVSEVLVLDDGRVLFAFSTEDPTNGDDSGRFEIWPSSISGRAGTVNPDGSITFADEFLVNEHTESDQLWPKITTLDDGRVLFAFDTRNPTDGDDHLSGVSARIGTPNPDGSFAFTEEFRINEHTSGFQEFSSIATLADGRVAFVFETDDPTNGDGNGLAGRILDFDTKGTAAGDTLVGISPGGTLAGLSGDDVLIGSAGDDLFLRNVGDGRDVILGGGETGRDLMHVLGDATAETYGVYSNAEAVAQIGYAGDAEIVVARNGTIIAELTEIEDIVIDGQGGGDTFNTHGSFDGTNLATSTITHVGSEADDTVDLSGLSSVHRVVFHAGGGDDAITGDRDQDLIDITGLTIVSVEPIAGDRFRVTFDNGSTLTYDGNAGFAENAGTDDETSVTIEPTAQDDTAATDEDTVVQVTAGLGLLANDSDFDGGTLSIVAVNGNAFVFGTPITLPSGARVTVNADGSYAYDPNGAFEGLNEGEADTDSFTYTIDDGQGGQASAAVTIDIAGRDDGPILGTPDEDTLDGTGGNDDIRALASDDTINGSGGSDLIDGGPGHDAVVYDGERADFTQTLNGNGTITVEKPGGGTDTLTEMERIDFTDGDYVYDLTSPNTGFGYRIYQASFGRTPDEGGVRFWIGNLDNFDQQGWSDYEKEQFLASQFIQSDEFRDLYGANPSNFDYIDAMYQNVLFRLPDQAGYDFWVGGMENDGLTREDILIAFTKSDENVNNNSQNLDDGVWVV